MFPFCSFIFICKVPGRDTETQKVQPGPRGDNRVSGSSTETGVGTLTVGDPYLSVVELVPRDLGPVVYKPLKVRKTTFLPGVPRFQSDVGKTRGNGADCPYSYFSCSPDRRSY